MKKTRLGSVIISFILLFAMIFNLSGCATKLQATNLMTGITPNKVNATDNLNSRNDEVTDFAVRLFKASYNGEKSTLISPLSVLCALAMTSNGAENETLEQMESVLGMKTVDLNRYLYSYIKNLPQGDDYKLSLANSIWFTDNDKFTANKDFLQTNADYYGADIYKAPFNNETCEDINNWVKKKTDKMIPKILDDISQDAVMYLINAMAFEAEWHKPYEKEQVRDGKFSKEKGKKPIFSLCMAQKKPILRMKMPRAL